MSTPARRTRTGCKTCRQRKLKCDEIKPVCGQCRKSNRECAPSEGISFRHAQNAGIADEDNGDLSSFYKYRQKFDNTYFLPVPKELSFVHVTDPYADEPVAQTSQRQHQHQQPFNPPHPRYQQQQPDPQYVDVAASSLKAMIDPALEQSTADSEHADTEGAQLKYELENVANLDPSGLHHQLSDGGIEKSEQEQLQDTIIQALRQTDEATQSF